MVATQISCYGRHIQNSSDIGEFVILSEESIAKGIRRIVALTGNAAQQAVAAAQQLESQIHDGATLDDTKKWNLALDAAAIPVVTKDRLRVRVDGLRTKLIDAEKKRKAALADSAVKQAEEIVAGGVGPIVVRKLEVGANSKALTNASFMFKAKSPQSSVLLLSVDADEDDVVITAIVPKETIAAKGLKANEWIDALKPILNGKGGGKDDMASLNGKGVSKVAEILALAEKFAATKLQ